MDDQITANPALNPYAPPKASIAPGGAVAPDDAERVRRELLDHETSVRAIGFLYLVNAASAGVVAVVAIIMGVAQFSEGGVFMLGLGVFCGLMAWISYYLGMGLRRLDAKVRTGTTILAVLGLLGFPLGTLINGYILYLLHGQKGKRVMTPEYQAVVAQTPHIKYRSPLWLIILVVLIAALVIVGLVMTFAS